MPLLEAVTSNSNSNVHLWLPYAAGATFYLSLCGKNAAKGDLTTYWYRRRPCAECYALAYVLAANGHTP